MSDLAKDLLTQYYGLGEESNGKKFLSIHQCVKNIKRDEEKQVTEQTSLTTNEENVSEEEFQKENDESRKLSIVSESYRRPSGVFDDIEDPYDLNENVDDFEIDFGPNVMCNVFENAQSSATREQSSNIVKRTTEDPGLEIDNSKDANENDLSLTFLEDAFPDSASDASSTTLKRSLKSSRSKTSTNLPQMFKKEPVYNETFADFSNTELKHFPNEILNKFPYLRMLYMADNNLTELPDVVFTSLRYLEWLDVRNNQISSLPASVKLHPCLETILLQGNKIENLPLELCTVPKLRTLQVAQNPLITPPKDIVASGYAAILEFLRTEWNNANPEERVEFKENKIEPKLSTILCYQSPRKKKKIAPSKCLTHNKALSIREKRKSYKPSNRYYDEKILLNNADYLFKKYSTTLCDSCLQKLKNPKYLREKIKCISLNTSNDFKRRLDNSVDSEIDEISDKVLRLMGPSPRSSYVRKNVKILKTYRRSMGRECRNTDKFDRFIPVKMENQVFPKENEKFRKCRINVEQVERVFDIVTNDGKRLKLNPMRLSDPKWMLSCLENYSEIRISANMHPSELCENKGANISMEYRLLWLSKLRELFAKQTSILQKVKDESVLKEWRRDKRSFSKSMEKAMKRSKDNIPFGFDMEDYLSIFKQNLELENWGSKKKSKHTFVPPTDINRKIDELLKSLNELEVKATDETTPRTKQNLFKNEMEKILQFQNEIQNLRKYNDVATVSLRNN